MKDDFNIFYGYEYDQVSFGHGDSNVWSYEGVATYILDISYERSKDIVMIPYVDGRYIDKRLVIKDNEVPMYFFASCAEDKELEIVAYITGLKRIEEYMKKKWNIEFDLQKIMSNKLLCPFGHAH